MPIFSSAAWVAHDLGLATAIGGSLYGKAALQPALAHEADQDTRDRVSDDAWRRFSIWNLAAHGVVAATWLVGRTMLSGREAGQEARALTVAKDVCVGVSLVTGIATTALGRWLGQRVRDRRGPESGGDRDARERSRAIERAVAVTSTVNLVANIGALGTTALLAMQAAESPRFALTSRHLP
jgi:hypothetical protein